MHITFFCTYLCIDSYLTTQQPTKQTPHEKDHFNTRHYFCYQFNFCATCQSEPHDPLQNVHFLISEQVTFPQHMKKQNLNEKVSATVKLYPSGDLEVMSIETSNSGLREYVEKQLESLNIPTTEIYHEITMSLNFNFKVL